MKRTKLFVVTVIALSSVLANGAVNKKTATKSKPAATQVVPKVVNINKADAETLAKAVKGFGPKRAEAIVKYRKEKGNFKTIDDLQKCAALALSLWSVTGII